MELSLFIVILLLILAVVGLIVGVSNDAVNFVNSAVGSKAAKFNVILTFAVMGLLVGVTFSSGMMDVAKSGIFHPEYFGLLDIMFIFLSVMLTSVLLLDLFNTFGLPTSTTIALVAGLFGSAFAISFFKLLDTPEQIYKVFTYLNLANLFKIFTGIILSVAIAFICGTIVQFFARLIFTFNYEGRLKRYGGLWVGFAMTVLMYFIFLKGVRGISFISQDTIHFIEANQLAIFGITFISSTVISQVILLVTKINILRVIVLIGTFSLALSFAANDLVNFIGAPLAGLTAYQIAQTLENPLTTNLGALATTKVQAETWMLIISGVIMSIAIVFSKKARTVTKTEVSLGRQDDSSGFEKFESNAVARSIVRMTLYFSDAITKLIPQSLKTRVNERFSMANYKPKADENGEYPSFDLLRASVTLVVSSALISLGTSFKLPLSTTYVTFIVAMATAFADRSWGRDTAVYRVSGVVTVIGGWFFTAISAIILAFIIAAIIYYTSYVGIILLCGVLVWSFVNSAKLHKQKEEEEKNKSGALKTPTNELELATNIQKNTSDFLLETSSILIDSNEALIGYDLKLLRSNHKRARSVRHKVSPILKELVNTLKYTSEENLEKREALPKTITSFVSIADNLFEITKIMHSYIDNNHYFLLDVQIDELKECNTILKQWIDKVVIFIDKSDIVELENSLKLSAEIKKVVRNNNKNQLKRIKKNTAAMKRSMLFITLLKEYEKYVDDVESILYVVKEAIDTEKNYIDNGEDVKQDSLF